MSGRSTCRARGADRPRPAARGAQAQLERLRSDRTPVDVVRGRRPGRRRRAGRAARRAAAAGAPRHGDGGRAAAARAALAPWPSRRWCSSLPARVTRPPTMPWPRSRPPGRARTGARRGQGDSRYRGPMAFHLGEEPAVREPSLSYAGELDDPEPRPDVDDLFARIRPPARPRWPRTSSSTRPPMRAASPISMPCTWTSGPRRSSRCRPRLAT